MLLPGAASADFEEVRILRTEPFQVQTCPPTGQMVQAPQPAPQQAQQAQQAQQQQQNPPAQGITGREILGGVAGAAVGGLLGNQVGSGSGRTAATVAGAGVGAYAGYKLAEQKPSQPPPQHVQAAPPSCTATHYRVYYARPNGMQGDVTMTSHPTGTALMINFCGDRPCN
jgi:uncharacterized protein YcfJ